MSWPTVALAEVCEIKIGRTPPRNDKSHWDGANSWLCIADMNQGSRIVRTKERIADSAADPKRLVEPGTVLLSFKLSIGKVAIADIPLHTNEAIAALPIRDRSRLDPDFLAHALRSIDWTLGGNRAAMGTTLNKATLERVPVPLPPLPEQRRIAAILDHADALLAKRRQTIAHLDTLAHRLYSEACRKIGGARIPLGRLADVQTGPFGSLLHQEDYVGGGVPLINPKHIVGGRVQPERAVAVDEATARRLDRFRLCAGDVVMARRGDMGRCAEVTEREDGHLCGTGSLIVRPHLVGSSTFIAAALRSSRIRHDLEQRALGVTMLNLNQAIVGETLIPDVPIEAQRHLARATRHCAELASKSDGNVLKALQSSLQSCAFAGEL